MGCCGMGWLLDALRPALPHLLRHPPHEVAALLARAGDVLVNRLANRREAHNNIGHDALQVLHRRAKSPDGARSSPAASVARSPRSARSGVAQSMACSTFPAHPGVGGGGACFIALRVSLANFWACLLLPDQLRVALHVERVLHRLGDRGPLRVRQRLDRLVHLCPSLGLVLRLGKPLPLQLLEDRAVRAPG